MTIQLPVLIWTVICFCVFALVIYRLLLKPLLAVMDARRAKVDSAREQLRESERLAAEAEEAKALAAAEAKARAEAEYAAKAEKLRADSESELKAMAAAFEREKESARDKYGEETAGTGETVAASVNALAEEFAERLFASR